MTTDYGRDTSCTRGIRSGRLVRGTVLLAEAIFRRLTTPPGMLRDDPSYGLDLEAMIGLTGSSAEAGMWAQQIRNQCLKDERLQDAIATVTRGDPGTWDVTVDCIAREGEPFSLRIGIAGVTVELLGITA